MKSEEEKLQMLREQVNSKIRWGARDQEVRQWLDERHGIVDEEAEALLADAHSAKSKAVRTKALFTMAFALVGILFAGAFIGLQLWGGVFVLGYGSVLIIGLGFASLGAFLRSLFRLFTGRTHGSVD